MVYNTFCRKGIALTAEQNFITPAPLAQLEEHLTLNQGVQGSSPWRRRLRTCCEDYALTMGSFFRYEHLEPVF